MRLSSTAGIDDYVATINWIRDWKLKHVMLPEQTQKYRT